MQKGSWCSPKRRMCGTWIWKWLEYRVWGGGTDNFLTVCKTSVDPLSGSWEKTAKLTKRPRINNDGCCGSGDSSPTNDCRRLTGSGWLKTVKRDCRWPSASLARTWKMLPCTFKIRQTHFYLCTSWIMKHRFTIKSNRLVIDNRIGKTMMFKRNLRL